MKEHSADSRGPRHDSPESTPETASRGHRGRLSRCMARLAAALAPVVTTIVVSAPAGAWPEMGG